MKTCDACGESKPDSAFGKKHYCEACKTRAAKDVVLTALFAGPTGKRIPEVLGERGKARGDERFREWLRAVKENFAG